VVFAYRFSFNVILRIVSGFFFKTGMSPLACSSEGSLDLWAFQNSIKGCIDNHVPRNIVATLQGSSFIPSYIIHLISRKYFQSKCRNPP
jgi:hypothetical protein